MSAKSYTLEQGEKTTHVMVGAHDMLVWGDLITKEAVQMRGFLNTLAEAFVPLHDAKILFLAPTQQTAPLDRTAIYLKREEILFFYTMSEEEPLPEETEVRRLVPIEVLLGSYQIEGTILKSPITTINNLLLVVKDDYMPIHQAAIRHVAKPWLGTFSASMVQVRRDRLNVATN
jgi:hypothetical protein